MIRSTCLLVLIVVGNGWTTFDQDIRSKGEVDNFNMDLGFASTIQGLFVDKFIELVDDQKVEIDRILEHYDGKSHVIIANQSLSLDERYDLLLELRDKQDVALKNVLLPQQMDRLEQFPFYLRICDQGFANSLAKGTLANRLTLTKNERKEVEKAAEKAAEEYRKALIAAQKKAISRLRDSIPADKQDQFDNVLKPVLAENGTFWHIPLRMLDTTTQHADIIDLQQGLPNGK